MLKEYIEKIQNDNNLKLNSLEREMHDLVDELNYNEQLMEKLQHEKKIDTNIFSPRKIDDHIDEKIENCQEQIKNVKQRMEYVSQMVEEGFHAKKEYQVLYDEVISAEDNISMTPESLIEPSIVQYNDINDPEKFVNDRDKKVNLNQIEADSVIEFLNDIYFRTETALALINGNKNRCKSELRGIMNSIKEYTKSLKKE